MKRLSVHRVSTRPLFTHTHTRRRWRGVGHRLPGGCGSAAVDDADREPPHAHARRVPRRDRAHSLFQHQVCQPSPDGTSFGGGVNVQMVRFGSARDRRLDSRLVCFQPHTSTHTHTPSPPLSPPPARSSEPRAAAGVCGGAGVLHVGAQRDHPAGVLQPEPGGHPQRAH